VLACAALLSIHSCSLGAPILLEEAKAAGVAPAEKSAASTPACDAMRAVGQWNTAWNPFVELDPLWTDEFFAAVIPLYRSGVMPAKELGLFSIACDASFTHMLPGRTRTVDQPGTGPRSNRNPLDLIKRNLIAGPIIELRCARAFMRRHGLRVFQRAAGFEIGRDPRGAKGMAADPYASAEIGGAALDHAPGVDAVHRRFGQHAGAADGGAEQGGLAASCREGPRQFPAERGSVATPHCF
jgi:hypothetical protein